MIFFDIIILGVYYLIKPIYLLLDKDEKTFGAIDHSLLIAWSAHSANISSIVRLLVKDSFYYKAITITSIVLLIILGYCIYYDKGRMKRLLKFKIKICIKVLITILVLLYIFFNLPYS